MTQRELGNKPLRNSSSSLLDHSHAEEDGAPGKAASHVGSMDDPFTMADVRRSLGCILRRFRAEGARAAPVVAGRCGRPELMIMPYALATVLFDQQGGSDRERNARA